MATNPISKELQDQINDVVQKITDIGYEMLVDSNTNRPITHKYQPNSTVRIVDEASFSLGSTDYADALARNEQRLDDVFEEFNKLPAEARAEVYKQFHARGIRFMRQKSPDVPEKLEDIKATTTGNTDDDMIRFAEADKDTWKKRLGFFSPDMQAMRDDLDIDTTALTPQTIVDDMAESVLDPESKGSLRTDKYLKQRDAITNTTATEIVKFFEITDSDTGYMFRDSLQKIAAGLTPEYITLCMKVASGVTGMEQLGHGIKAKDPSSKAAKALSPAEDKDQAGDGTVPLGMSMSKFMMLLCSRNNGTLKSGYEEMEQFTKRASGKDFLEHFIANVHSYDDADVADYLEELVAVGASSKFGGYGKQNHAVKAQIASIITEHPRDDWAGMLNALNNNLDPNSIFDEQVLDEKGSSIGTIGTRVSMQIEKLKGANLGLYVQDQIQQGKRDIYKDLDKKTVDRTVYASGAGAYNGIQAPAAPDNDAKIEHPDMMTEKYRAPFRGMKKYHDALQSLIEQRFIGMTQSKGLALRYIKTLGWDKVTEKTSGEEEARDEHTADLWAEWGKGGKPPTPNVIKERMEGGKGKAASEDETTLEVEEVLGGLPLPPDDGLDIEEEKTTPLNTPPTDKTPPIFKDIPDDLMNKKYTIFDISRMGTPLDPAIRNSDPDRARAYDRARAILASDQVSCINLIEEYKKETEAQNGKVSPLMNQLRGDVEKINERMKHVVDACNALADNEMISKIPKTLGNPKHNADDYEAYVNSKASIKDSGQRALQDLTLENNVQNVYKFINDCLTSDPKDTNRMLTLLTGLPLRGDQTNLGHEQKTILTEFRKKFEAMKADPSFNLEKMGMDLLDELVKSKQSTTELTKDSKHTARVNND